MKNDGKNGNKSKRKINSEDGWDSYFGIVNKKNKNELVPILECVKGGMNRRKVRRQC